jgi:hypothetical protein
MQNSQHTKAHTFASRTSPSTDQSLQKSVLFQTLGHSKKWTDKPRQTEGQLVTGVWLNGG